ncbi:hypothetical protein [Paraburkholderia sediminicola]|uniref:hypothetical protein n=1 Tax=Paraburkholderia sediminicola TaxID=458836 RepID=UPI001581C25C|nr:hypothetical protein [Paraburkholderia sediminicola]
MHNIARVAASLRLVTLDKGLVKKWWRRNRATLLFVALPSASCPSFTALAAAGQFWAPLSHAPGNPVASFTIRLVAETMTAHQNQ